MPRRKERVLRGGAFTSDIGVSRGLDETANHFRFMLDPASAFSEWDGELGVRLCLASDGPARRP